MTFITHYVLLRAALQLASADHRYAQLGLPDPPLDSDDELLPLDEGEDAQAPALNDMPGNDEGDADDLSLYHSMALGRQARDPAQSTQWPRFSGAGKKLSWRTKQWGSLTQRLTCDISASALQLLITSGQGLDLDLSPGQWRGGDDAPLHKDMLYFRYNNCRLSHTCVLSCAVRDREVEESRGTQGRAISASSFALVRLPEELQHLKRLPGDDLVPARILTYAGILWKTDPILQRVAYVKLLPYVPHEVCPGTGYHSFQIEASKVDRFTESERVRCIPIEWLCKPLVVIKPKDDDAPVRLWELIPFSGKKFGLTNRIESEVDDTEIPVFQHADIMSD